MANQPENRKPLTGLVLNIQHFCTHDGPGIRTTVFLKACSVRCKRCSNPESIHAKPELAYNPRKCIGEKACGRCLKNVCPESAIYVVGSGDREDDKVRINWELCTNCGKCVPLCPTEALYLFGHEMTVDEVLDEVEQDASFYRESGGGITVSGGECQLQADFLAALLSEAHERGINTAIETAGNVAWSFMEKVLPHVDTVLHDHKLTDPERHRKWCGVDNRLIRANFKKAYETFPEKTFIARTPVIPGVNDDEDHIRAVLALIRPHKNVIDYELLPYHRFGESKYDFLGRVYELADFQPPTPETLKRLQSIIDEAFGRAGTAAGAERAPQVAAETAEPPKPEQSAPKPRKASDNRLNAVVTLRNEISPWLIVLRVAPDGWDLPAFSSGQFCLLGLPGSAPRSALAKPEDVAPDPQKLIRRAYSIASSSSNREFLEFYIALVPGGALTPRLFNLNIGDRVWLSEKPSGMFTFDQVPENANLVLMATGSGLAPYVSMLSTSLMSGPERRVAVLHGARHSWDLGYRSTLMAMQNLRSNFIYLPVVSRPDEEPVPWTGATGHVQALWKSGALEKAWGFRPAPDNAHVFLCGTPEMTEEMVAMLVNEGFKEHTRDEPGQIHAEKYWKAKEVQT
jgi:pyruvate formate lyase activating enzyme